MHLAPILIFDPTPILRCGCPPEAARRSLLCMRLPHQPIAHAGLPIKFKPLSARDSPCLNCGFCYGDDQTNEIWRLGTLCMKDVSDGQITEQGLAVFHDMSVPLFSFKGPRSCVGKFAECSQGPVRITQGLMRSAGLYTSELLSRHRSISPVPDLAAACIFDLFPILR